MSRLFDDAQSEYLEINQAVLSGTPLAMVCLFNTDELDNIKTLMCISDKDISDVSFWLALHSNDTVFCGTEGGGVGYYAYTTSDYSADTWQHACGIFASATDRRVLIDGGNKGTNADAATPAGLDRTSIGVWGSGGHSYYMSGKIAEAAIYDLSVWPGATAADKADNFEKILLSLIKYTPSAYPLGRVAYWDLVRND